MCVCVCVCVCKCKCSNILIHAFLMNLIPLCYKCEAQSSIHHHITKTAQPNLHDTAISTPQSLSYAHMYRTHISSPHLLTPDINHQWKAAAYYEKKSTHTASIISLCMCACVCVHVCVHVCMSVCMQHVCLSMNKYMHRKDICGCMHTCGH